MIRNATLEDYEDIKKLVNQVHKIHCENRPDIYKDGNALPIEYFKISIENKDCKNYVYCEDEKIVGFLMAAKKSSRSIPITIERTVYFIDDIVVDNKYRRKGIGKKLYNHLLMIAKNEGVDAIELNVWAFNKNAIKFYESLGMTIKNMKLEKILNENTIHTYEEQVKITEKVD